MNSFETLVGIAFVKCNLLLVCVWLAWVATPVTALRARVGLWRVAIVGSMLLIAASLTGPTLRLPWLPGSSSSSAHIEAKQLQAKPLDTSLKGTTSLSQEKPNRIEDDQDTKLVEAESFAPQATETVNVPQSQRANSFVTPNLNSLIGIVWPAGSLLLGFRFVRQWRSHAYMIADSVPVEAPITELADAVSNLQNSRELRSFELRWTTQLRTPAVTGVLKPVILLPESWRDAPTEKLQAALAHESAHIQSRDIVWSAVIELFRVVTWPSPLVWGIAAAHRSACERLADYQAWNAIGDRANYRSMLANLALEMMGSKSRFALSMVRTPQILDRLKLMENLKTNNRLGFGNKLLQAAIFTMGLLIGTAAVVPRTLLPRAQARSNEPQETEKPPQSTVQATDANQDPATTPKVSFKQAATFNRESILVLDPDGAPAKDAVYIVTGRIDYQLDDYAVPSVAPKALPVDNQLKLDMPEDEFIAVWNANGFCQYTVSRLSKLESLKLQPWCKLTVHLRDGQLPLQDFRVSARLTLTTDGMFQGICFKNFGVTDDQGSVTFDRLPPGELEIAAEPVDSGATKIAVKRSKYLLIAAGAKQVLTIGDQGRGVTGRVVLPQGIDRSEYSKLEGQLINQTTADWLTFPIGDEGIFKTDRVPEGECTISVRTSWSARVRRLGGNKSVTLSAAASELNGRQFIGTISVSAESDRVANDGTFDSTPIQANDAFVSDEKVAWITTTKLPEGEVYVLKSAAGKTIRTLDEDFMHVSFGRNKQNVAIDATRNRVYILANGKQSSCSLLVLDLNGKQLYTVPLKPNGYHLTLDPETGNIWMTAAESIGKTELMVFDSSGKQLQKYNYDDGTAISYSSMDRAIWMAGAKKIVKIDPATGKILASFTLPKGCWNCTYSLASTNGGVFAFELNHPDMPSANNRIWHIDSDGNARANIELGDFLVTTAGLVQNELWISGFRLNRLWSQSSASLDYRLIGFDLQLNQFNDVELPYQLLHANQDGQAAWVRQGDEDLQVTLDADRKLKILNKGVR